MTEDNRVHFELDDLLHPAQAYSHPSEVVDDPDLTTNEKQAILASWASDAVRLRLRRPCAQARLVCLCALTRSWRRCEAWTNKLTVTDTAAP